MGNDTRQSAETALFRPYLSLGQDLQARFGEKVHKVTINAAFTCPNRDGTKGIGGCTFCNNASFSPRASTPDSIEDQIARGAQVIRKRTGARKYLAYFQSYTNTYADLYRLQALYDQALAVPDVVGLAIGTRPDCVPDEVLNLLSNYQAQGYEVWLELGLQSSFDASLARVNRGHGFGEYVDTCIRARQLGLKVCTHLIVGLPGEAPEDCLVSLQRVLDLGTDGLKIHPLHVVRGTQLAREWRRGLYHPLSECAYVDVAIKMVSMLPAGLVVHRLTGTANEKMLLAPDWCARKWRVLNAINSGLGA